MDMDEIRMDAEDDADVRKNYDLLHRALTTLSGNATLGLDLDVSALLSGHASEMMRFLQRLMFLARHKRKSIPGRKHKSSGPSSMISARKAPPLRKASPPRPADEPPLGGRKATTSDGIHNAATASATTSDGLPPTEGWEAAGRSTTLSPRRQPRDVVAKNDAVSAVAREDAPHDVVAKSDDAREQEKCLKEAISSFRTQLTSRDEKLRDLQTRYDSCEERMGRMLEAMTKERQGEKCM